MVTSLSNAQRNCAYPSLLLRNLASATFDGDANGNWIRVTPYLPIFTANSDGLPATTPLNGTPFLPAGAFGNSSSGADKEQLLLKQNSYLYSNPSPNTGNAGVCEAGYETRPAYTSGQQQKITIGTATSMLPSGPGKPTSW